MVKHCYAIGFWVVVPVQGNKWQSHYLSGSSIQKGQESPMPIAKATKLIEVTVNYKGDKIAASTYAAEGFVTVYDFDSKCGTVSNEKKLKQSTSQIAWDYPLGLDFSPNNQFLYVCYSVAESQLVQYDMSDLDAPFLVATGTFNFDDILMAPDGRAYLNRHVDGNPSRKIDILQSPNLKGAACGYQENAYQLKFLTSGGFQLPPFINAYEASYCEHNVREFQSGYAGIPCVGNTIDFFTVYPNSTFTSAKWVIDYNGIISTETGKNISIPLNEEGQLKVLLIKGFCNLSDTIRYELEINSPPTYSITNDTTVCFRETLNIEVETDATKVLWSTGNDTKTINVAAGLYAVQLSNGSCSITDSVSVTSHPPLSILLGDNYYICENENELIKLDAGKGFVNYLWHPTNDTTQWIIVNRVGDYFVVVDDFRGCKGDKGTKVDTRCNLVYFVPNAFSPNGDGKNDNFTVVGEGIEKLEMQIYNRWGELIFKSNSLAGWSGNNAQEGVYTYLIKVEGFKNKKTIFYHLSGNVTLLK
jgi:gliding motility-associated-like protein